MEMKLIQLIILFFIISRLLFLLSFHSNIR